MIHEGLIYRDSQFITKPFRKQNRLDLILTPQMQIPFKLA